MKIVQQKGASQKEFITMQDKTVLKLLASIKLDGVKPIGSLQEAIEGKADIEKSLRVWRGSKQNPLSVWVNSDNNASYCGCRFYLEGDNDLADASWAVGAVKGGELKLYEMHNKNRRISWADYDTILKIVKELGAELADYRTAIPAIVQALGSPELSKDQKDAIKIIWFYVQGKDQDLSNLKSEIYTWGEATDEDVWSAKTKETIKTELLSLED